MKPYLLAILTLTLVGQMTVGTDLEQLVSGSTVFAQNLHQKIARTPKNVVFSPYSIHACLSMCYVGAGGDTATEMSTVLGLTSVTNPFVAYQDYFTQINSVIDVELYTANAIFMNQKIPILDSFITTVQTYFFAVADYFDLNAPEGPEKKVNDFVSDNTNGLIKNVLPPDTINEGTVMVLVNTIFFNGTWARQFEKGATQSETFFQGCGKQTEVPMMHDDRHANIKRNVWGADVLELPFEDPRFSLYIVLPTRVNGIRLLEQLIATPGRVDDFFTGLQNTHVRIAIPKFKIETGFDLNDPLKELGMVKAFQPGIANFSGIAPESLVSLSISKVIHRANIEVQETGTVASAVTIITVFGITSVQLPPTEMFIANHPFLFFLRDNQTGYILFQGKYSGEN